MTADLVQFLKQWKTLAGVATAAVPWLGELISICPPWPSPRIANSIVLMVQFMICALAFTLWRKTIMVRARPMVLFTPFFVGVVLLVVYVGLFGRFVIVYQDEEGAPAYIIGHTLLPEIEELRQSDPALFTDRELLDQTGRKPPGAWTSESINSNAMWLLTTWILAWSLMIASFALFVAHSTPVPNPT